jgi:hypothetical protein
MPRYYFDIDDGDRVIPDAEGTEMATVQEARAKALHMLGDIAKTEMQDDNRSQQRIRIRDESGHAVLTVSLFVQD